MRIALVSLHTSPGSVPGRGDAGGMNVVVSEAAHALSDRGHEVVVVTRATTELSPGECTLDASRSQTRLVVIRAGDPALGKRDLIRVLPEAAGEITELGPFDAVHAHYWLSGIAAGPAATASGVLSAITFHTVAAQKNERLAPGDTPEPPLRIAAERALARSSYVIAGSQSELDSIERSAGEPAFGSEVIHPGVDTVLFRPLGRAPGADVSRETEAPMRVLVLGRLQPLKGQDLAIAAFAAMGDADPELAARVELVIAGEPSPGQESWAAGLLRLAERLGVSDRVRFLPAQDREASARLLAGSAVALVPSHSETFGLVAAEAAACGVPVLVGAHTGLLEAAPHEVAGLQVPGRDPAAWGSALARLLGDPALRAKLGVSARKHALSLDWRAHAERLERRYQALRALTAR
ncbi:glycosyltransferase [Leucobacter luti]|uniref:glycosyltransferase n=1 Tax=Leucobacter luti TaxID=340320 RepID=UPI003D030A69